MTNVYFHTIYENEKHLEFTLSGGNYFRSSTSKKEIKHCYEITPLETLSAGAEFGFSCVYHTRTFVAFYSRTLLGKYNDNTSLNQQYPCNDISISKGETLEVCYDSLTNMFKVIKNDKSCEHEVQFSNPETWFVYLDHVYSETSDKVSLNLGREPFKNPIPKGFEPWFTQWRLQTVSRLFFFRPSVFIFLSVCFVF